MTDRPIAAVLALIAAIVFVAAFSAAAVMRPNQAAVAENTSSRTAPAASTEEVRVARLVAPSLSRVAALPALHLPKHKPAKKKAKKVAKPKVSAPVTRTPVAPRRPSRRPPRRVSSRPRAATAAGRASAKPSTPRDDPPRPARPAAEPAVDGCRSRRGAARRRWRVVRRGPDRRRSADVRGAGLQTARRRSRTAAGVLGLGARAAGARAARARGCAGVDAVLRPRDDGLRRAGARRRPGARARRAGQGGRRRPAAAREGTGRRARGARLPWRPRRRRGPGRLRHPDHAWRADDRLRGPQRRPGGAHVVPERARPDHGLRCPADRARRGDRVPHAGPRGPEGARRRARAPAGRAAALEGAKGQRRAARTLWKAYVDAAGELSLLAPKGEPPARVVASLRDTGRAYRQLGDAAKKRSRRSWARARTVVAKEEKTLKRRLAAA